MRTTLTVLFSVLLFVPSFAQKDIPAFGKIDIADLKMTRCEEEPDAAAYKLLDYGDVEYELTSDGFRMKMIRRTRIKIFSKKGFEHADVKLRYYTKNNYEQITELSAKTYNLDAAGGIKVTNLEKSSIFNKKVDKQYSEVIFTMPEVKEGSVIEYKYNVYLNSISNLRDWYFQDFIPTRLSVYKVLIPQYFVFMTGVYVNLPLEDTKSIEEATMMGRPGGYRYEADRRVFRMNNIPSIKWEPHMSSYRDYMQRVEFQLSKVFYESGEEKNVMSTWPLLAQQLMEDEDFGAQLKKPIVKNPELTALLANAGGPHAKMCAIYDYVRKSMNWNGSDGIYSLDGVRAVWEKKAGSTADLNLVLINLLKNEGISAYPILVSTRDHGIVNAQSPFLHQFNKVLAFVEINGNTFVLNAAEKYSSVNLIPENVMNTKGFVVDLLDGGIVDLYNSRSHKTSVSITAKISEGPMLEGEARVHSQEYARILPTKTLKENESDFLSFFKKDYTGVKIDSFTLKNKETDTLALEQTLHFKMPLNTSGEYNYFTLNLFSGLRSNPFVSEKRFSDIDFGYNQSYTIYGNIILPDNYVLLEKPKDLYLISPDSSITFQRLSQLSGNVFQCRLTFAVRRPFYPATAYADLKELYKKIYELLDEQLVIQKKEL